MKMPLMTMLISPSFLYRAEEAAGSDEVRPVEAYDLASRLSYFLWSSMPDDTLFAAAASGKLAEPAVLDAQITRMLRDQRAGVLGAHFAGQWLGWEELRSTANPDTTKFPEFTYPLRAAMYREAAEFFHHLVQNNGSAFDLIDCNYTYLNEQLARHYGIAGVTGPQIRKVTLTDRNRGGVLGMGAVLVATSMPLRTSPAIRGAYVLEKLLGTPPPEPPMDVPQLAEDDREIRAATFRAELEMHRDNPDCKSCHQAIDPLGFGLENFDAVGRWRTTQNGNAVDASGTLPDGRSFTDPAGLKKLLLEEKELFIRNLVGRLLAYALGRELTPFDRPVIAEITAKVLADRGGVQTAFREVAKSYPFLNRRDSAPGPALGSPVVKADPPRQSAPPDRPKNQKKKKRNNN
jgi:hypothetical protein